MTHAHVTRRSSFPAVACALGASILCALTAAGCASAPRGFSQTFPDNRPEDLARVTARLAEAPAVPGPRIAVGANGTPTRLVAFDYETGTRLWERQPEGLRSAPLIAGESVITQEASEYVVRSIKTGDELYRGDTDGGDVAAAAGEGARAAVVLAVGAGTLAEARVVLLDGGRVRKELDIPHIVGAPAVRGDLLFLPWGSQNLSVIDMGSGDEIARVRLLDTPVTAALESDGQVFVGGTEAFVFGESLAVRTPPKAQRVSSGAGVLPGTPPLLAEATAARAGLGSAVQSVRLAWRAASTGSGDAARAVFGEGNLYFTYYRAVFALEDGGRRARWAYLHSADVVGAHPTPAGLLIGDNKGDVTLLHPATGAVLWTKSMARGVAAMRFAGSLPSMGGTGAGTADVTAQLSSIAGATDARLVAAQALAVELIEKQTAGATAGDLIALCENRRLSKAIRQRSCAGLAAQRTGEEDIMLALSRHASFLENTVAPPVGALGTAAVGMKLRAALPLLAAHLRDPMTPSDELPALVEAIAQFQSRDAAAPIRDFVRLYHADQWETDLARALVVGVRSIAKLEGPASRELLEELGSDPLGMSEVQDQARAELAMLDSAEADKAAAKEAGAKKDSAVAPEAAAPAAVPTTITSAMTEQALASSMGALKTCARKAQQSVRVVLLVEPSGELSERTATPVTSAECVSKALEGVTYPPFKATRSKQVIFSVTP
jgi:outer membrane protein assembly factor BamB